MCFGAVDALLHFFVEKIHEFHQGCLKIQTEVRGDSQIAQLLKHLMHVSATFKNTLALETLKELQTQLKAMSDSHPYGVSICSKIFSAIVHEKICWRIFCDVSEISGVLQKNTKKLELIMMATPVHIPLAVPKYQETVVERFKDFSKTCTTLKHMLKKVPPVSRADLSEEEAEKILTSKIEDKGRIMKLGTKQHKVINDPIHGTISLHPLAMKIIDTPQFQRLRHINQLGGQHYVYPSATYSRFEHSIGVYHLAGKLVGRLREQQRPKEQQPELQIDDFDSMCVQLAGLTHDLGHGPFSRIFEEQVVPSLGRKWTHKQTSVAMLDYIYRKGDIEKCFKEWEMTDDDFEFIKSLVLGKPDEKATGRGTEKKFLYEIVASQSGIDVDKWDYLARDCYHLGIKCGFELERLLYNMRVVKSEEELKLFVRDKEADNIRSIYYTKYKLYNKAYQHKVVLAAELMLAEALVKAAPHLRFSGKTMLECLDDKEGMEAYTDLHDGIFYKILYSDSDDSNLQESRTLLRRLQERKFWKFVCKARFVKGKTTGDMESIKKDISRHFKDEIKLRVCARNYGRAGSNPLNSLMFYSKDNPPKVKGLTDDEKLTILPEQLMHMWLLAYYTGKERPIPKDVKKALKEQFESRSQSLTSIEFAETDQTTGNEHVDISGSRY